MFVLELRVLPVLRRSLEGSGAPMDFADADEHKTRIHLPSDSKKTSSGNARATIGIVAGGGRTGKPPLKVGRVYHKYKANQQVRIIFSI